MTKTDLKSKKSKNLTAKKAPDSVEILGIRLSGSEPVELLKYLALRIAEAKKTFIVTPNPEFLVYGQKNPWFKDILNKADIAIPDGMGLVWAARLLGQPLRERIDGVDLASQLLVLAAKKHWRVGIIGARRGVRNERTELLKRLKDKYPTAEILAFEETPDWQKRSWEIIFACQGMGEQEKWIWDHLHSITALIFMGAGGALDQLTGLILRPPGWIRKRGFGWLYRLIHQPWRFHRQLALIKFVWLVLKEKFAV